MTKTKESNQLTERDLPRVFTEPQVNFLNQITPSDAVKERQGPGGLRLKYISHGYVTRLLNEVFGFDWDFDIEWQEIGKREVIVRGRLTVRSLATGAVIEKTQYGGSTIKFKKDLEEPLSVADDLKSAASDCLKKCASLLGIGLDLYDDAPAVSGGSINGSDKVGRSGGLADAPASESQINFIENLMHDANMSAEEARAYWSNKYDREVASVEKLTKNEASAFIKDLKENSAR